MDCKKRGEHAVVVGASLAGMSQAAVLSRYFEKVTILESDTIDLTRAASRKGVPQDRQLHGLLNRGVSESRKILAGTSSRPFEKWRV